MPLFHLSEAPASAAPRIDEFGATAGAPDFPCVFAPKAFAKDELLFGTASYSPGDADELVSVFLDLVDAVHRDIDQVVVIWLEVTDRFGRIPSSLTDDRALAGEIVRELVRSGGRWPAGETTDPADPTWNLWFHGVDLFLNFSTRHHRSRRSRNLGSTFTIVAQSRASFDRLPGDGAAARRVIRQRVARYDTVTPSPVLGTHGAAVELPQYFLGDVNECPFHPVTRNDVERLLHSADHRARHA